MLLVTVDRPNLVGWGDYVRVDSGATYLVIPRHSGKLRLYSYRWMQRGRPFSRPVPAWITDRMDELRDSLYGAGCW
jgi:hypothetical protein